jgi:predicted metal-dependent peptidase
MDKKQLNKAEKLAEDVLVYSRNTLLVNLRFLDMALSQFEMFPCEEYSLMTDGKYLLYNPKRVLKDFRLKKEISVRAYLHIVMHCVYRHMFMSPTLDRPLWDLACDIAVENVILDLG